MNLLLYVSYRFLKKETKEKRKKKEEKKKKKRKKEKEVLTYLCIGIDKMSVPILHTGSTSTSTCSSSSSTVFKEGRKEGRKEAGLGWAGLASFLPGSGFFVYTGTVLVLTASAVARMRR